MSGNKYVSIYLGSVTLVAFVLLALIGLNELFYWSFPLLFLTVACILSEWLVIRLPQGDRLTLSIISVLLALLFGQGRDSYWSQVAGTVEVLVIGSLVGYVLIHRPPWLRAIFYVAQYVVSAIVAGGAFALVSMYIPSWFITTFHLPAVTVYIVVFSILSSSMVGALDAQILHGERLPKADPFFVIFLAPIALIIYYFFQMRGGQLSVVSVVLLALPLLGILSTFRLYINIDTEHGEVTQLFKISQSFVAAMSQEETVQKVGEGIAQAINELIDCDACLVYVRSNEANEYILSNLESGAHGPPAVMPEEGILGHILVQSNGDIVNDVAQRRELSMAERRWTGRTSLMAYPLHAENQVVGLLVLLRYRRGFTAEDFRMVGIIANQAGVTLHNAQMYEQSLQMAATDRKLNILNQAAFIQKAQRAMGRAQLANQSVALMIGDIDDFRKINNTFGHPTGDLVLAGVAQLMKQRVGDDGSVGRRGGEEFGILLPGVDEAKAMLIAEEIRQSIQEYVFKSDDGRDVQATISVGVALFPRDAGDVVGLDRLADRAAYLAKRMGKNRVCLYEDQKEKLEFLLDATAPPAPPPDAQLPAETTTLLPQEQQA